MQPKRVPTCDMEIEEINGLHNLPEEYRSKEANIHELVEDVQTRLKDYTLPLAPKLDFDFIAKFVRVKKYKPETATSAIRTYYDHKFKNLRRIEGVKPSVFTPAYKSKAVVVLKNKFQGTKSFYVNFKKWDTRQCSFQELVSSAMFMVEELALDKELQPHGNIVIFDLAGLCFSQLKQLTFSEVKYSIMLGLDGLPTRVEGIHVINAPMVYWPLHKIIMKVLPPKIRNRFHLHSNVESLHVFMDKNILPSSLGGVLDEDEATDTELIQNILAKDRSYDEYWSIETSARPRRMTRKRSSMMMMS